MEEDHTPSPQMNKEELRVQIKEQRKRYLEIKEQERNMRKEAISSIGKSNSPGNNISHTVMNSNRRQVPLFKQLEEKFMITSEEQEKEKY